jgi:adenosine deaminase
VRYIEVRFAPQLHVHDDLSVTEVLRSVSRGLERARAEINQGAAIRSGAEPRFEFGIIVCAMRMFTGGYSDYFRRFTDIHSFTPTDDIYALASLELARAVVALRDAEALPVVAFDLAGAEAGYPAGDHVAAYNFVHKHFMNKTVHAGEAYGPESIFQAITELHADRIGHGCHLFSPELIQSPHIKDREKFVQSLAQYIAEHRITIEVCLTSNSQTIPAFADLRQHPFGRMIQAKLSATLCTDNRLVSHTTVSKEIELAASNFEISPHQLKNLIVYGFKRSFFPGTYNEKRAYVRQVFDFYEATARTHGVT